ncbi:MAG: TonB-dependent receptor plug domain-containing protein, partial [Flavisolibacter sp.]
MNKALMLGIVLGFNAVAFTQDTAINKNMEEVMIFSNKFAEKKKNIVQKIDIVTSQRIAQLNSQNTGDLLMNTGNVFVQKSQQGGSSPVIRGFEANRVLLVVDGIRMNNAIYRAGHLQNVITVDQNMLERVEILYGPGSTLYGSDALGGIVHFRTKAPKLSLTNITLVTGSAFARYSSANNEKTGHIDISIAGKKFGWLQSYNYSDFDDMKMGSNYTDKYPNFGRRSQYVENINGIDSVITNKDDRVQKFSGYRQWDITEKFLFKPNEKVSHLINLQYSNSGSVPRYDRLQDVRNGTLRFADWYYGPQFRGLAAYELNINKLGFLDLFRTVVSYQQIKESRHQRDYRRYDMLDNRNEKLHLWNFIVDGKKNWGNNELTIGADAQLNDLKSAGFRKNIITGAETPLDSRYPNGDNNMNYFGVYAQHILKFGNGKFVLNDGLRVQTTRMHSTIADNTFFNFPFTEIDQNNTAITGNLGLVYMSTTGLRINGGFSSGFRTPNIDDLARIFESNTASRQLVIPNPDIKPEYTFNFDLGIRQTIAEKIHLELTGFYTLFRNAIALAPFQLNGQDSVNYNGAISKVFANQNVNRAFIYGFNAGASI